MIFIEYKFLKNKNEYYVNCIKSNDKEYDTFINLLSIYGYKIHDLPFIIRSRRQLIIKEMGIKIIGYHKFNEKDK